MRYQGCKLQASLTGLHSVPIKVAFSAMMERRRLPMSALDQKRTSHWVRAMSALPSKADIKTDRRYVRCSSSGSLAMLLAIRRTTRAMLICVLVPVVCSGARQIKERPRSRPGPLSPLACRSFGPVENSDNSELRRIFYFPSHSGHRAVVHRSRSETCAERV